MKKKIIPIVIILACAVGLVWWFLRGESPEAQVRKRFVKLSEAVQKKAGETGPIMALKSQTIPALFADEVEIEGDVPFIGGKHSAETLTQLILSGRMQVKSVSVIFKDLSFDFPAPDQAVVTCTGQVTARGKMDASGRTETREIVAQLVKKEGVWLFSRFKIVKIMEK